MSPLLPLPGVRPVVRDTLGAITLVAGPVLIVAGAVASGLLASALATLLLAHRRLRAANGWDASRSTWVRVTTAEIDRASTLLQAQGRWARDPWHCLGGAAGGAGLALATGLAAGVGGVLLGVEAGLVARLGLAALAALAPAFCVGGRVAAAPEGLAADLGVAGEFLAAARAHPEPAWQPVPELLLAAAGDGHTVPARARLRLEFSPDPPALGLAVLERGRDGRPRATLRLHAGPAARAITSGLPEGFAVAAGADHLQVELLPGLDLRARLSLLADRLCSPNRA